MIAPSTTSDAEAVNVTTAPLGPVALTVMPAGTVTTGGVRVVPFVEVVVVLVTCVVELEVVVLLVVVVVFAVCDPTVKV
jgi:hypothetical protein